MRAISLLLALSLLVAAGCVAAKKQPAALAGVSGEEAVKASMRPFLDCTYSQYGALAGDGPYDPNMANLACDDCAGLLEFYKDTLNGLTKSEDFSREQARELREYAKKNIAEGLNLRR